jgi:hypothetical protein
MWPALDTVCGKGGIPSHNENTENLVISSVRSTTQFRRSFSFVHESPLLDTTCGEIHALPNTIIWLSIPHKSQIAKETCRPSQFIPFTLLRTVVQGIAFGVGRWQ